ncbi:MAG TPA: hypothetical protein VN457_00455 [Chlamydiales bacterium]|nr:hypothetical protein [Chlamydiales bacterium]
MLKLAARPQTSPLEIHIRGGIKGISEPLLQAVQNAQETVIRVSYLPAIYKPKIQKQPAEKQPAKK